MEIAWFHSHLMNTNSGGTRFVIDYASGLAERFGHSVTLYCDIASKESVETLAASGVKVIQLDTASTNSPIYWLTLFLRIMRKRKKLEKTVSRYDALISSMFPMNWLTAGFDAPKIQMCYEPFAFFYDKGFLQNFKLHHRLFFKVMKLFYQSYDKDSTLNAGRLLTVNKTNIPKIESEYGILPDVVYAGIDTRMYHRASQAEINAIRKKYAGSPILFHSTDLTGIKGTFPLLEVIAMLVKNDFPKLKLLITVYVSNPDGIRKLQACITRLGLDENVEYIGCLPKNELPLYYSAVDFVCQPSINQPANWPLKEALLCGTPIIGGAESEEAQHLVNGAKIDLRNPDDSYEKLKMLFSPDRSFQIDNTALLADYSFNGCLDKFNRIIKESADEYKTRKNQ